MFKINQIGVGDVLRFSQFCGVINVLAKPHNVVTLISYEPAIVTTIIHNVVATVLSVEISEQYSSAAPTVTTIVMRPTTYETISEQTIDLCEIHVEQSAVGQQFFQDNLTHHHTAISIENVARDLGRIA